MRKTNCMQSIEQVSTWEVFRYRLFNILCIRGSGVPDWIFHNQHKTLYNLFSPDPAVSCVADMYRLFNVLCWL